MKIILGAGIGSLLARPLKSVNSHFPKLMHPCPYGRSDGEVGVTNTSPTLVLGSSIPRAIPDGLYKLKSRLHTKTNKTLFAVELVSTVTVINKLKIDPSKLLAGLL